MTEGAADNDRLFTASEFFSRARKRLTFYVPAGLEEAALIGIPSIVLDINNDLSRPAKAAAFHAGVEVHSIVRKDTLGREVVALAQPIGR
jgi:hypothetical protein